MHKLIDYVCDELESIERKADKGSLSMSEIQYADTLAHLKKNLMKAEEMSGGEYSMGYSGKMYHDGRSYARGRRRDSMGRYSRDGYSMAADDMIDDLRELMDKAPDEHTRKEFQKFIQRIESM